VCQSGICGVLVMQIGSGVCFRHIFSFELTTRSSELIFHEVTVTYERKERKIYIVCQSGICGVPGMQRGSTNPSLQVCWRSPIIIIIPERCWKGEGVVG